MSPFDSSAILGKFKVTTPKLQRPLFSNSPCSLRQLGKNDRHPIGALKSPNNSTILS